MHREEDQMEQHAALAAGKQFSPRHVERFPHGQGHRSMSAHLQVVREVLTLNFSPPRTERLPLMDALDRGLAETILAPRNLPPFDNSQMDGFAVRSTSVKGRGTVLKVGAPVPAGNAPTPLPEDSAAPIMTGAMMPLGADAVIPIELAVPDVFPDPSAETTVELPPIATGSFVRRAGDDITAGECALTAGTHLGPRQLGLLAGLGMTEILTYRPLTVLLVTTGDEVIEPGDNLTAGKIYDANNTLLESSMRQAGLAVIRAGIVSDDPAVLSDLLRRHAPYVDLIVTTGGVGEGAYEPVRQALVTHDVDFSHVAIQPGGPQGVGTFDGTPILAFPGNSVSCLISFELFLRPIISEMFGAPSRRVAFHAPLAQPLTSPRNKHQVRRGTFFPNGTVRLEGGAGSHLLAALARSNVLVHIPEGITELAEGAEVEVWAI